MPDYNTVDPNQFASLFPFHSAPSPAFDCVGAGQTSEEGSIPCISLFTGIAGLELGLSERGPHKCDLLFPTLPKVVEAKCHGGGLNV